LELPIKKAEDRSDHPSTLPHAGAMISVGLPTMLWRVKLRLRDEAAIGAEHFRTWSTVDGPSMIELEIARFETCRARLGPSAIASGPFFVSPHPLP